MGAWDYLYQKGTRADSGTQEGYGILAVKRELDFLGYPGLDVDSLVIGNAASRAIIDFQRKHGLDPDGVVGPLTGRQLYKLRIGQLEAKHGVPDDLACKIVGLESAFDPAAIGVSDPADHGIVQINATAHPTITLAEAYDPAFALEYLAAGLQATYAKLHDWDCAVASWNVGGGGASDWCGLHKPSTGGPSWFPDLFARATHYVALVKAERC
jgi:hypothetical protein